MSKLMNKKIIAASALALLLPTLALAAFNPGNVPTANTSTTIIGLIDLAISFIWPVIMVAVILLFAFAGFQFFSANGDAEKVKSAQQSVIWGVVGTVVIFLAWSIPFMVRNTIDV